MMTDAKTPTRTMLDQMERPLGELEGAVRSLITDGMNDDPEEIISRLDAIKWHCTELQSLLGADNSPANLAARKAAIGREIHRLTSIIHEKKDYLQRHPEARRPDDRNWFRVMDRRILAKETTLAELKSELKGVHVAASHYVEHGHAPLSELPDGQTIYVDGAQELVIRREWNPEYERDQIRVYRCVGGQWRRGHTLKDVGIALRSLVGVFLPSGQSGLPDDTEALRCLIAQQHEEDKVSFATGEREETL